MTRIFLLLAALVFLIVGAIYLIQPAGLAKAAGLQYTPSGLTDIRATYGGFQIGLALFLGWSAMAVSRYPAALMALLCIFASVGLGRLYGVLVDQELSTFHIIGLTFELVITLVSAALLRRSPHTASVA